jgi:hypothetical protein
LREDAAHGLSEKTNRIDISPSMGRATSGFPEERFSRRSQ